MSYADARLDLMPVGVACLIGPNGAGKSALLDAVTWALWENARAGSEELIRLGQTEMWIDLCFELDQRLYRVRRSRQKNYGKTGQRTSSKGNLDVQIFRGAPEHYYAVREKPEANLSPDWISLNAGSMKETQERLREILKMDYDTFVSSVYLRQGKADEFAIRSAGERKQVLADILGLSYFDRLQELAREEVKERKIKIQILEAALNSEAHVEQGLLEIVSSLEELMSRLHDARAELTQRSQHFEALSEEVVELRYLEMRAATAQNRQVELKQDLSTHTEQLEELKVRAERKNVILSHSVQVRTDAAEFEELKKQVEILDKAALAVHDLSNRRMEIRSKISMTAGRMEVELEHLRAQQVSMLERDKVLAKSSKDAEKLKEQFREYKQLLNEELEMSRRRETFMQLSARAEELQLVVAESRIRLDEEIQQKLSMLEELERIMMSGDLLEAEQTELKGQLAELDSAEAEFERVEERGIKIKSRLEGIDQQILQLKRHRKENAEKVRELTETPLLSSCPLCRSSIVDGAAVLDRYKEDNLNTENEIAARENESEGLIGERDELRKQYLSLRRRLDSRKMLDMKIGQFNEKQSALQRAELNCNEMKKEIELARQRLSHQDFAQVERESLVRIKAEIGKLEFDPVIYASLQSQIRAQRHTETRYQQMQRDMQDLEIMQKELPVLQERIRSLESGLREETFEAELRGELKEIDEKIAVSGYDRHLHQAAKEQLVLLLPAAEALNELNRALIEIPELESDIGRLSTLIESRHRELSRLQNEQEIWQSKLRRLPDLEEELGASKQKISGAQSTLDDLQERRAALEAKLQQLSEGKSNIDAQKQQLALAVKEMGEFNFLSEAFGKKGIQAVIIENAIPEIESEANRLLSRLSDNQMHVAMVTQQLNRMGNSVETLEILIADELGTRSYELYSGGEAFKVNFAIRVALSRLLARRVGARLETLIIDEGFGSQDEASRAKLVRAINSIKQDFARILVVTHIAEVKDMFPVQIAVEKEQGVSQLHLMA